MIRRNCCSATSMPAAVERLRMSPSRQRSTLRCVCSGRSRSSTRTGSSSTASWELPGDPEPHQRQHVPRVDWRARGDPRSVARSARSFATTAASPASKRPEDVIRPFHPVPSPDRHCCEDPLSPGRNAALKPEPPRAAARPYARAAPAIGITESQDLLNRLRRWPIAITAAAAAPAASPPTIP